MINIEIPPSAPVTKEEREKWLEKAEYGGKTRRLIDHIERMESELEKAKCLIIPFLQCRIEQAEAERDLLANKMADISDKMNGWNPPPTFCHACNICPANSDDEMEGVTCEVRILEWAQKEAEKEDEKQD